MPWLAAIVHNEAVRNHAGKRSVLVDPIELDAPVDDERLDAVLERHDVEMLLASLDPLDRRMMLLRYGEDMTQPAIAQVLGIPEGTVKVRLHRARKRLRGMIE